MTSYQISDRACRNGTGLRDESESCWQVVRRRSIGLPVEPAATKGKKITSPAESAILSISRRRALVKLSYFRARRPVIALILASCGGGVGGPYVPNRSNSY